jgi:hypothetical protein
MIDIEDLEQEAEKDLTWSMTDCDNVCLRIPSLKAKWASKLYRAELESKSLELQIKSVYARLHESYLSGNKTNVIVDRRDVDIYITGDEQYIKVFAKLELAKGICKWIENVLRGIDSMSFSISAAVKWNVFKEGG